MANAIIKKTLTWDDSKILWDVADQRRGHTGVDIAYQWQLKAKLGPTLVVDNVNGVPVDRSPPKGVGWNRTDAQRYDDQLTAHLLTKRREPAKYRKGRGITPAPVYIAQFAGGHEQRVSFWTPEKGPVDFAAGYNVALLLGRDIPISGRVEFQDGRVLPDLFFDESTVTPIKRKPTPAVTLKAIIAALNADDIATAKQIAKAA